MAIRNIRRQATNPLGAAATTAVAPIYVDSDDNILKIIPAGSGTTEVQVVDASSTQTLTNKTLTAPTLTAPVITGAMTVASGATLTSPTITAPIISTGNITDVATGNLTLLAATHGGGIITISDANSANIITLPDATGSGVTFTVIIVTVVATGTLTIVAPDGDNVMVGTIVSSQEYDSQTETMFFWNTVAASDTITINGTTQGGRPGDWIALTDIAADKWHVRGMVQGSGTEVTPFSANV